MNKKEKEQTLLRIWIAHKYHTASNDYEAIDWSNHPKDKLESIEEIAEYSEWRDEVKDLCIKLKALVNYGYFEKLVDIF